MTKQEATKLAENAVRLVTVSRPEPVADTTVLFKNEDGTYSVTDNGEEVDGLDSREDIRIIVENLTTE